jgi:hypothetical protein
LQNKVISGHSFSLFNRAGYKVSASVHVFKYWSGSHGRKRCKWRGALICSQRDRARDDDDSVGAAGRSAMHKLFLVVNLLPVAPPTQREHRRELLFIGFLSITPMLMASSGSFPKSGQNFAPP